MPKDSPVPTAEEAYQYELATAETAMHNVEPEGLNETRLRIPESTDGKGCG